MSSSPLLTVSDLVVSFAERSVLDGLNLEARSGHITTLLGPNGAGKTTLIRCCTGLIRPTAGRISLLGAAPGSEAATTRVGVMPQSTGAWSGIKPGELLRYLASLYADPQPVDDLIDRLGIGGFVNTTYRRLSGGQQQAVNLAGALVGRPELVFLDEPTAGLDPHARRSTWKLLEDLRTAGVTTILTTHAMEEAEHLADQIFIIDRGRVTISGSVPELTRDGDSLEDVFLSHTTSAVAS